MDKISTVQTPPNIARAINEKLMDLVDASPQSAPVGEGTINTHRRLFDLVRHQRAELHAADLITDPEYAWLLSYEFPEDKGKPGSPSPRRLEDYDDLRHQLEEARSNLQERVNQAERTPPTPAAAVTKTGEEAELLIIDAAVEVAVFSKTHEWPAEASPNFFKFIQLLDDLTTKIAKRYPEFNKNILAARASAGTKESSP